MAQWVDTFGVTSEGAPPAGYWVASDGRWYPPQPGASADAHQTLGNVQQPASMVVLWEGQRESLTAVATAGKMVSARYKLTEDAIHFEAGLLSTKAETVPLWAVVDVDLKQSITQRARGVGDLFIRVDQSAAQRYGQAAIVFESIKDPKAVRDIVANQANKVRVLLSSAQHARDIETRRASASVMTIGAGQSVPSGSTAPVQPPASSVIEQLKELAQLKDAGILTDEEFAEQKRRVLAG
jgi:Bacterial PH domain/Short C-terminal domain